MGYVISVEMDIVEKFCKNLNLVIFICVFVVIGVFISCIFFIFSW